MFLSESPTKSNQKVNISCDRCNKILCASFNHFKDKTGSLCNVCFTLPHACSEQCAIEPQECTVCKQYFSLNNFSKSVNYVNGHARKCKNCRSIENKAQLERRKKISHDCIDSKCHQIYRICTICRENLSLSHFANRSGMSKFHSYTCFYCEYQDGANRKNIIFELSRKQFFDLIFANCNYCGIESVPNQKNGVDKIIPKEGYIANNSVPCCWACNRAKGSLSLEEFQVWSNRFIEFNKRVF